MEQNKSKATVEEYHNIAKILYLLPSIFGGIAVVLNTFVIVRIIHRYRKEIRRQKIFFLSLAFADGIFGMHYASHLFEDKLKDKKGLEIFEGVSFGLAFVSGVLHIIALTIDRFLAVKYPIYHRLTVTEKKRVIVIVSIWIISVVLMSMQFWVSKETVLWVVIITILIASFICIVSYTYIARLSIKSVRKWKDQRRTPIRSSQLNTTVLSFTITVVFITCNVPFAITKLTIKYNPLSIIGCIVHSLMGLNAVTDPIIYTIVELVHKKYRRYTVHRKSLQRSSGAVEDINVITRRV